MPNVVADLRSADGQDLVEYALLVSFISIVAVASIQALGQAIRLRLWDVINQGLFH